ncbi:MAG: copper chaperone PCu(A)C [Woeseiaceae bacterium]|nr:copper chaperone PCu(A)C [Woeseiaceae bacterium]
MRLPVVVILTLLAACGSDAPPVVATDVVVKRPMPGMQMSAGYLTLRNNSDTDIAIDRVTSPQFGKVEMHETVIEDGVSRMRALGEVSVPAGSAVEFKPGGKHLMLMRPGDDLDSVTLEFHSGESMILSVSVTAGD